jgi:hypothetical protein
MGEVTDALKRFRRKLLGESDTCFLPTPKVVFCVRTNGFHEADSLYLFDHCNPPG